jgi:hypothetical protein
MNKSKESVGTFKGTLSSLSTLNMKMPLSHESLANGERDDADDTTPIRVLVDFVVWSVMPWLSFIILEYVQARLDKDFRFLMQVHIIIVLLISTSYILKKYIL